MSPSRIRTAATLGVLTIVLLLALVWGWNRATSPLPGFGDEEGDNQALCLPRGVKKGKEVTPRMVVVNVANAGTETGLADSVQRQLTDRGFAPGRTENAPSDIDVDRIQVWADDPTSPAAVLVASQFYDAPVSRPQANLGTGIVVVVGDDFIKLAKGRASVTTERFVRICSPNPARASTDADTDADA